MFCAYTRTRLQDVYMTIGPHVLVSPTDLGLNLTTERSRVHDIHVPGCTHFESEYQCSCKS